MELNHLSQNGECVIVICDSDLQRWFDDNEVLACSAMITAWSANEASIERLDKLVRTFLEKGCKFFVCAGSHAESLHDSIDDIILMYNDTYLDVVTSYHVNEEAQDVIDFFLSSIAIKDKKNSKFIAVLDVNKKENRELEDALMKA